MHRSSDVKIAFPQGRQAEPQAKMAATLQVVLLAADNTKTIRKNSNKNNDNKDNNKSSNMTFQNRAISL